MTFSRARLRGHRQGRRLSQTDLALRCGLQAAALADIEAGHLVPAPHEVLDLAEALGIDVEDLRSTSGSWAQDYCEAIVAYLTPMTDPDIAAAANALHTATHAQEAA